MVSLKEESPSACLNQHLGNLKMPIPAGFEQTRLAARRFAKNKLCWPKFNQYPGKLLAPIDRCKVQGCPPLIVNNTRICAAQDELLHFSPILIGCRSQESIHAIFVSLLTAQKPGLGGRVMRSGGPAKRSPDGLGRACLPRLDGKLQRRAT
jgi:hypothetical protein